MALDTNIGGSGITGYITKIVGTNVHFVRQKTISGVDDYANSMETAFDDAKTAGASVAGTQIVNFSGSLVGGDVAGFGTGTLTGSIIIDGVVNPISITVSPTTTVTTTITKINANFTGFSPVSLVGGDIVVTSNSTGNTSNVLIVEKDNLGNLVDNIFSAMTGFVNILAPVDGGTGGALIGVKLSNGTNAYNMFVNNAEVYNSGVADVVIQSKYPTAAVVTVNATNLNAELNAIKVKLDALQDIALRNIDVISPIV